MAAGRIAGLSVFGRKPQPKPAVPKAARRHLYRCRYCLRYQLDDRPFCEEICRQLAAEDARSYAAGLHWKLIEGGA